MLTNTTEIGTAILLLRSLTLPALTDVSPSAQSSATPDSPARSGTTAPPRRSPRFPALARAALACVLALAALATPALAQDRVPANWSLKPTGLTAGAQFRLLFLSSTTRDGTATDIADYNTFIQNRAAAGHVDIQAHSTGFRVVGCTADTDARDNTGTTGTGVPIYWLNGAKAADDYADFYDSYWDDEANDKNESGTNGPDTSQTANWPITGCTHYGTKMVAGIHSRELGSSGGLVRVGRPNSAAPRAGPLSNKTTNTPTFRSRPMYGLSAVFQVAAATAPGALTGLAAAGGIDRIDLSWTAPASDGGSAITGYKIEVSPDGITNWTDRVANTGDATTTYAHTGLAAGTTRHYRVSAINTNGTGDASNVANATTGTTVPGAPTVLSATASRTTQIDLSWIAPASNGGSITGYKIEVSPDGITNWTDRVANTGDATTTYAHTGLAAGTTRHYRVSAINTNGTGDASNVANATTATTATTVPGVPTVLSATASGSTRINLSWTVPASDGGSALTGYKIEVSSDGGSNWSDRVADTGDANTTYYAHTGLTAGATRHYRVSAINTNGTGDASNVANATSFTTVPGAPTSLSATASWPTQINLSWTAPANNGGFAITGYRIEISLDGITNWRARAGNATTTYFQIGLAPGTTRHYRVSARNTNGLGAASNVANATTGTTVPGVPTDLSATASGTTQIDLSWTAPASNGGSTITGHKIEVSSDGGSNWTDRVANTGDATTTYAHTGLAPGTTRHYRVSASNTNGTGATSNVAPATTGGGVGAAPLGGGGGGRRSPPPFEPEGSLENPGAASPQSGIGLISGWVCEAEAVEIEIATARGTTVRQEAAYGTERLDTAAECGDTDNGFGLLFNWNLLGDGEHEVVAFVDGVELDRATVTVTTLGEEFLREMTGTCEAADFPMLGETVTLAWQQTQQNFVLVDGTAPRGESRAGVPGVGYLENPGPNAFQSGIGVLSGWVCEAGAVEIAIETESGETERHAAGYGTERGDTQEVCGDTDNGFGLLFNWNRLGEGEHEVIAFVDDVELGRATVRVTTLGEEFVRGAEGECVVEDFPALGQTVTLEWQQTSQNFVIVDYPAGEATAPPTERTASGSRGTSSGGSGSSSTTPTTPQSTIEPAVPDLEVGTPTVSDDSLVAGAGFSFSVAVRNTGAGASPATTLRYYRSADDMITTDDTQVGMDEVAGLAASGNVSESVELSAPSSAGPYYYGACVDAVTDETNTENNCSQAVEVTVLETQQQQGQTTPDLVVESPSVSDDSLVAGAGFTLSVAVRNTGAGASPATTLRYYRSADDMITTDDTQVGMDEVAGLAASGNVSESVELSAPSSAGPYYYGACVDAVTDETNTENNCSQAVEVTVLETQQQQGQTTPDLVVESPSVSDDSLVAGAGFSFSVAVRNTGAGASPATTLRYYRSADDMITTDDTQVGMDEVAGLAASGNVSESVELSAPSSAGPYYYGACVDAVTDETNTENNCSQAVEVTVLETQQQQGQTTPDLVVESPSVSDDSLVAGAAFSFSVAVRNTGAGASPATTLRYYRSADDMITTDDTQVGMDEVAGLAASGNVSESVELSAPSSAGPYYYGACVDAVTDETNTENNCSQAVEVTVLETQQQQGQTTPDLVVESPSVSDDSLVAGAASASRWRCATRAPGLRPPRRCAITARRTI